MAAKNNASTRKLALVVPVVLRKNTAFARLWTATTISGIGSLTTFIALPLAAYESTGSASAFAAIMACTTAGTLLMTLIGGAFADRWDRKRLLITGDASLILTVAAMGVAVHLEAWVVCAMIAFFEAAITATFRAASPALQRDIVDDNDRVSANALTQLSYNSSSFVGPLLGAALFPLVGFSIIAAIDVVTFAISIALIMGVKDPRPLDASSKQSESVTHTVRNVLNEVRSGARIGVRDPYICPELLASMCAGVGNGMFIVAAVPWLDKALELPPSGLGVVIAVVGISGIITAVIVSKRFAQTLPEHLMIIGGAFGILGSIAFFSAPPVWVLGLCLLSFGIANVLSSIGSSTLTQRRFPSSVQGRLGSLQQFGFHGFSLVGNIIAAGIAASFGVQAPITLFAILLVAAQAFFLLAVYGSRKPVLEELQVELDAERALTSDTLAGTANETNERGSGVPEAALAVNA